MSATVRSLETSLPYQLYTPKDAAKLLAISERHLYTLTQRGDIAVVRMGRAIRYSSAELTAFVIKQMQQVEVSNNAL